MKINTFREDTISRTTKLNYKRDSLKLKRSCKVKWSSLRNKRESTDDTINILCEKRKRVAWQNVLMSFRETQFTSAIDLLKAVTVVTLGFLMRRKKMIYFIRPRNYPTWQGIAGYFTIITGKLGEPNRLVCICFVTKPAKPIEWNLHLSILKLHCMKRATGVSAALSTICSTGKIIYIQIIRTDLWSFQAH